MAKTFAEKMLALKGNVAQGVVPSQLVTVKADHLLDLYKTRGYRVVGRTQWDGTNYESLIMSLKLI